MLPRNRHRAQRPVLSAHPVASWGVDRDPMFDYLRLRGVGIERLCILASTADFTTQLPWELNTGTQEADVWEFIADKVGSIHFHPSAGTWVSEDTRAPGHGDEELCVAISREELLRWPAEARISPDTEFWSAVSSLQSAGLLDLDQQAPS